MKQIALNGKKGNGLFAIVDDDNYERFVNYKWYLHRDGYAFRAIWNNGPRTISLMHREVIGVLGRTYTDHINGNKLDNRIENLRECSQSQNLANRGKNKNNTSGFKGVYKKTGTGAKKWCAQITLNRKTKYLGLFLTPEEAHKAYTEAAIKYFGEFAQVS